MEIGDSVFVIDPTTEDIAEISFFGEEEKFPIVGDIVGINAETVFIQLIADPEERVVTQPKDSVVWLDVDYGENDFDYKLYIDHID